MSDSKDDCEICSGSMENARILDCSHKFCLACLEKEQKDQKIKCPTCFKITELPPGIEVNHLPQQGIRSHSILSATPKELPVERTKPAVSVIKSWKIGQGISDVILDEGIGIIFLGTDDKNKPIRMYSITGKYSGHLKADVELSSPLLGLDTTRNLLLAMDQKIIVIFDEERRQKKIVKSPMFKHLGDISYYKAKDVYIIGDTGSQCFYFINPKNYKIMKTIPAKTGKELKSSTILRISCDKSGKLPFWATTDYAATTIRLYDSKGASVKVWRDAGPGFRQFAGLGGLLLKEDGSILVADNENHRIVCLTRNPSKESRSDWKISVNTRQFKLGGPTAIDMNKDGLSAVIMSNGPGSPQSVALMNGL